MAHGRGAVRVSAPTGDHALWTDRAEGSEADREVRRRDGRRARGSAGGDSVHERESDVRPVAARVEERGCAGKSQVRPAPVCVDVDGESEVYCPGDGNRGQGGLAGSASALG